MFQKNTQQNTTVISRRILVENEPNSYGKRTVHFFCSLVQQLDELRRFNTVNLRTSPIQKETKPTSTTSKTRFGYLGVFHLDFFGIMRLFELHQRVPLRLFRYFATQWMSKNPKGSPFYIFWHCDTVQKSHFKFFPEISKISQGSPLHFFFIFCNRLKFNKIQRVTFYNFEP